MVTNGNHNQAPVDFISNGGTGQIMKHRGGFDLYDKES